MTFEKWLIKQRRRNDPTGDLANDFYNATRSYPQFGKKCNEEYLSKWNACNGAFDALVFARKEYRHYCEVNKYDCEITLVDENPTCCECDDALSQEEIYYNTMRGRDFVQWLCKECREIE